MRLCFKQFEPRKVFQKQKLDLSADPKLITQVLCVKIGLKPGHKIQIMWAVRIFSLVATDLPWSVISTSPPLGTRSTLGTPHRHLIDPCGDRPSPQGYCASTISFCFKSTVFRLVAKIRNRYIQLEAGGDILRLKWYKMWLWIHHWPLTRMLTPGVRMTQEASDPRFGIHLVCITHSVHFSYRTHSSYCAHFSYPVHFS